MERAERTVTSARRPGQQGRPQENLRQAGQELMQMQRSEHWLGPTESCSSLEKATRKLPARVREQRHTFF